MDNHQQVCQPLVDNLRINIQFKRSPDENPGFFFSLGVILHGIRKSMDSVENNIIQIQVNREITALFKFYLELVEQLNLSEEQHALLRKQILNHGNDTIRNILQFVALFDFTINREKVEEEARKRIIFKKTMISPPIVIH